MFRARYVVMYLFIAAAASLPTFADSVYTYTGNTLTTYYNGGGPDLFSSPPYSVTGSFDLAGPLGDNLSSQAITPLSFSFTDGLFAISDANATSVQFIISTNASGAITQWNISLSDAPAACSQDEFSLGTANLGASVGDIGEHTGHRCNPTGYAYDEYTYNQNLPGTWTVSSTASIPEPATCSILLAGMMGLGSLVVMTRRRQSSRAA